MNVPLHRPDNLVHRLRDRPYREQFVRPHRQKIERAKQQTGLCAQYNSNGDVSIQL
jgi:hypothetical protein